MEISEKSHSEIFRTKFFENKFSKIISSVDYVENLKIYFQGLQLSAGGIWFWSKDQNPRTSCRRTALEGIMGKKGLDVYFRHLKFLKEHVAGS